MSKVGKIGRSASMNKAIQEREYVCSTWFERDRCYVRLETPMGRVVFQLWDEDVAEAIENGLLQVPKFTRASDEEWRPCAVEYARSQGLI